MTWKNEIKKEILDGDIELSKLYFPKEDAFDDEPYLDEPSNNKIRDFSIIRTRVYNSIVDISKEFELDKDKTLSVVRRVLAYMEGRDSL